MKVYKAWWPGMQPKPQLSSFLSQHISPRLVLACLHTRNLISFTYPSVYSRLPSLLKVSFPAVHSPWLLQSHEHTREGVKHLASLKFETRASNAIVSMCSLLLWNVTSKGVLSSDGGQELIVVLLCLLPTYSDCGPLCGLRSCVAMIRAWRNNGKVLLTISYCGCKAYNVIKSANLENW